MSGALTRTAVWGRIVVASTGVGRKYSNRRQAAQRFPDGGALGVMGKA